MNITKGWKIEPHDPTTIKNKNGDTIALCDSPYGDQKSIPVEQRLANAQLIAAAPDLYEALKLALHFIGRDKQARIIGEQALAKGEGK